MHLNPDLYIEYYPGVLDQMVFSIVKIDHLPLGGRILRYGCNGQDVTELQKQLSQAGFYFGEQDGVFGMLTGEAVTSLQKTFHLKVDGVAGRQVLNALNKNTTKNGRIIYKVKKNEELSKISERFAVKKSAWRRIPGQGNPHKRIYPGLKILLHEKAFFCWDIPDSKPLPSSITGSICADYQMEANGELKFITQQGIKTQNSYHLISAQRDVWIEVLSSKKVWSRLAAELKEMKEIEFGFDLREAPLDKITRWGDFLKSICCNLKQSELKFLMLPLLPVELKLENQLYWLNLPIICAWAKHIMIEPLYNMESPLLFEASAVNIFKDLRHLGKTGLAEKALLVSQVAGWEWNIDHDHSEKLSYKVARLIRAQYSRTPQYSSGSKFSVVNYLKHNENHCLIYRDEEGWRDFLTKIIELNLAGVVIANFKDLGKVGPEIIAGSFKVIREESFNLKIPP